MVTINAQQTEARSKSGVAVLNIKYLHNILGVILLMLVYVHGTTVIITIGNSDSCQSWSEALQWES